MDRFAALFLTDRIRIPRSELVLDLGRIIAGIWVG